MVEVTSNVGCMVKKYFPKYATVLSNTFNLKVIDTLTNNSCDSLTLAMDLSFDGKKSNFKWLKWDWGNGTFDSATLDKDTQWLYGENNDGIIFTKFYGKKDRKIKLVSKSHEECIDTFIFDYNTKHKFSGKIYVDENLNCQKEIGENTNNRIYGLVKSNLNDPSQIKADGSFATSVNSNGTFNLNFAPFDASKRFIKSICPANYEILTDTNSLCEIDNFNFGLDLDSTCSLLQVRLVSSGNRRRMATTGITEIHCSNFGLSDQSNVLVNLDYNKYLVFKSCNFPYSIDSKGYYVFNVGNLKAGETKKIIINDSIPFIDNWQVISLCSKAWIDRQNTCRHHKDFSAGDGSKIEISGGCSNDEVKFTIKNVGAGDMDNYRFYYVDFKTANSLKRPFKLKAGEQLEVKFVSSPGNEYRIKVEQHKDFPEETYPILIVAPCSGTGNTFGFVNKYTLNSTNFLNSYVCQRIRYSYDPNVKTVSPEILDLFTDIPEGNPLSYTIHFQNTGNDTAYKVVIKDELSSLLDMSTFKVLSSSHPFVTELDGREINFIFNQINLVDSITNEAQSHGFVEYSIAANSNLVNRTTIYNKAAIYFDLNAPIITNNSSVEVFDRSKFLDPIEIYENDKQVVKIIKIDTTVCSIYISPLNKVITSSQSFRETDTLINNELIIYSIKVNVHKSNTKVSRYSSSSDVILKTSAVGSYQWVDCFNNYKPFENETSSEFEITRNGAYAVIVNNNGCLDTSDCYFVGDIKTTNIEAINVESAIMLYPNPNAGKFKVVIEGNDEVTNIDISNLQGQLIYISNTIIDKAGEVDVSLTPGIYFIKIALKNKGSIVRKVIVQ